MNFFFFFQAGKKSKKHKSKPRPEVEVENVGEPVTLFEIVRQGKGALQVGPINAFIRKKFAIKLSEFFVGNTVMNKHTKQANNETEKNVCLFVNFM